MPYSSLHGKTSIGKNTRRVYEYQNIRSTYIIYKNRNCKNISYGRFVNIEYFRNCRTSTRNVVCSVYHLNMTQSKRMVLVLDRKLH